MTLPNFLVIGAPRSGTTWLHHLLNTHPDVWMPSDRKEVHYFDLHWDRGIQWYEEIFANADGLAIGETTPAYLICPQVPDRIKATLPDARFVAMLRSPVERLYSNYGRYITIHGLQMDFEEFVETKQSFVEIGYYSRHLDRYLCRFGFNRVHVVIFERATDNPAEALRGIGEFLGISAQDFDPDSRPRNATRRPRWARTYLFAWKASQWLRRMGLHRVVQKLKGVGIKNLFGDEVRPPMDRGVREHLEKLYEPEIQRTEHLLGIRLPEWRSGA